MRAHSLSIILAALLALAWLAATVSGAEDAIVRQAGMVPARLAGEVFTNAAMIPAWLTPLTANFVHGGVFHLIFNALILIYCGNKVEPAIGARWLIVLLVAGSYGAALAELAWAPGSQVPIIGASGSISALMAMYAMLFSEQKVAARGPIPAHVVRAVWLLAAWIGVQVLLAIATRGQVATLGHIGGFAAGLLLSRPILRRRFAR